MLFGMTSVTRSIVESGMLLAGQLVHRAGSLKLGSLDREF